MQAWWYTIQKLLVQSFSLKVLFSLLLTTLLCSAIGWEREQIQRPAGIRTHLLVGLSSALVMLTSEFLLMEYNGTVVFDPTRLGAQVISGIGFLGAGTIIKEGYNVKGLTTAASLWSVACIGLAAGCGFYYGAILLTIIILIALQFMRQVLPKHSQSHVMIIFLEKIDDTIETIRERLEEHRLFIHGIEIISQVDSCHPTLKVTFSKPPEIIDLGYILARIQQIKGVEDVYLK
ncbi:MAG: MgtC/SapB family protein [Epulopiscium sp.]|jgi:putative Mg2+ transporter-C (MgtC) family protein|nr:MgtC/SapB family protein [Candidatus Epulonipiscium sp.]